MKLRLRNIIKSRPKTLEAYFNDAKKPKHTVVFKKKNQTFHINKDKQTIRPSRLKVVRPKIHVERTRNLQDKKIAKPAISFSFPAYSVRRSLKKFLAKEIRIIHSFFAKKLWRQAVAAVVLAGIIISLVFGNHPADAATYTFSQTSWSGGLSVNSATHPDNQSAWNNYSAKDAGIAVVNSGTALQLAPTAGSLTQTDDGTTTSGFNLSGASFASTSVSGTSTNATIQIANSSFTKPSISISANSSHILVVKSDGTVWAAGQNSTGQLGNGTTTNSSLLIQVPGPGGVGYLTNVIAVAAGTFNSYALKSDGTVWSWAYNSTGQLGITGSNAPSYYPVQVMGPGGAGYLTNVVAISSSNQSAHVLKSDGTVWGWGGDSVGELGNNANNSSKTPVQTLGPGGTGYLTNITSISGGGDYSAYAARSDGTVWSWGGDYYGQLGNGTTTSSWVPVQTLGPGGTGFLTGVTAVSAGFDSEVALKSDGTVWSWGYNNKGQLGNNTTTNSFFPVQVTGSGGTGVLTGVTAIAGGDWTSYALKSDGTVWGWGYNSTGQLGINSFTSYSYPKQVYGLNGSGFLTNVVSIGASNNSAYAIDSSGNVYGWGSNYYGQLANNTTNYSYVPVQMLSAPGVNFNAGSAITYYSAGTYNSGVIDLGLKPIGLTTANYTMNLPTGTSASVNVRAGNSTNPNDGTWTAWQNGVASGASISGLGASRYVQYQVVMGTTNSLVSPSLSDITFNYNYYPSNQTLTSSSYNSIDATNIISALGMTEDLVLPTSTEATLSIRTAASQAALASSTWYDFTDASNHCTKTNGVVTCPLSALPSAITSSGTNQWWQYKITLTTGDNSLTPTVSGVTVKYIVNAPPQLQNVTASEDGSGNVNISYQVLDPDTHSGNVSPGFVKPSFQYWNGSTWVSCTTLTSGATSSKAVSDTTYTTYTLNWNAKADFNGQYLTSAKVRVTVSDSEPANSTATLASSAFTIDTISPVISSVLLDSRSDAQNNITVSATDNTMAGLLMKFSNNSDLSPDGTNVNSGTWVAYASTSSWTFANTNPGLYYQFKDAYGNTSNAGSISRVDLPAKPSNIIYQDVSNIGTSDWREFIAWGKVPVPTLGFKEYDIYRSTDGTNFQQIATQTDRTINYVMDGDLDTHTIYYYRVDTKDNSGNVSAYSNVISDRPDGKGGSDLTPPTISNIVISSVTAGSALVTWDTDKLSNSAVAYTTNNSGNFTGALSTGVSSMVDNAGHLGQHSVFLSGLTPGQTYYIQVSSIDASSNVGTSGQGMSFTTLSGPVISNVSAASIQNTGATVAWSTTVAADSEVYYSTSSSLTSPVEVALNNNTTDHVVSLTGLQPAKTYYFYVKSGVSEDRNIINGQVSYYNLITTSDSIPPVITFDPVAGVTNESDTSVILSWTTDKPATSTIEYGTSTAYGVKVINNNLDTDHTVLLTGLTRGTFYHFKLEDADSNGNFAFLDGLTFATQDHTDVTPPVITFDPAANITSVTENSALVSWTTNEMATSSIEYGTSASYGLVYRNDNFNTNQAFALTGLTRGTTYHFRLNSTDPSGNATSSSDYTFTTQADLTPPVITFDSNSGITKRLEHAVEISWSTNEIAASSIEYGTSTSYGLRADNSNFNIDHIFDLSSLAKGTLYHFRLSNVDASGNVATSSDYTFMTEDLTDYTPPTINFDSNSGVSGLTENSARIAWITSEMATSSIEYGISAAYGSVYTNNYFNTNQAFALTGLTKGTTYHFRLHSTDPSGNATSSSDYTFNTPDYTDRIPPVITFDPNSGIINRLENTVEISWLTDKLATSTVQYGTSTNYGLITSNNNLNLNHIFDLSGLTKGTLYHFLLSNTDASGNATSSSDYTFMTEDLTDYTPPTITFDPNSGVSELTENSARIAWITSEMATSSIEYGTSTAYGSVYANNYFNTNQAFALTGLTKGTTYHFRLHSTDPSGNATSSGDYTFVTQADFTPPVITFDPNNSVSELTETSVRISWTTDKMATSSIDFGTDQTYGTSLANSNFNTNQSIAITGLTKGTTYHFRLNNTDASGNTASSVDYTFATPDYADKIPPVITFDPATGVAGVTENSALISWTTNEMATSKIEYGTSTDYGSVYNNYNLNTNQAFSLIGLTRGTTYHFKLFSTDFSGNVASSSDYTFTTQADVTPPVITFDPTINITGITENSALVSWITNEMATSSIEYGTSTAYGSVYNNDNFNIGQAFTLSDLARGTTYHFRLHSTDASGNTVTSSDYTFTTQADLTPPVITFDSSSGITDRLENEVEISWSTDKLATSSIEYGTSTSYGTRISNHNLNSNHIFDLTGLTKGTLYHFRLNNADASGNATSSGDFTFITEDLTDYTPPSITFDPSTGVSGITETSARVAWTTSEMATSSVEYGTSTAYGSIYSNNNFNTNQAFILTGLVKGEVYHFRMNSTDASGNATSSSDYTFATPDYSDKTAPIITFDPNTGITNRGETSVTIAWATNEVSTSSIEYGTSTNYNNVALSNDLNTDHVFVLNGLSRGTVYNFRIKSADPSGNLVTMDNLGFVTEDSFDKVPPVITFDPSGSISEVTETSVRISWTTNELATSSIDFGTDETYGNSIINNNFNTNQSIIITGLTKGTNYHFRLNNTDVGGNLATSSDLTFTTLDYTDKVPPVISGVSPAQVLDTSATIVWTTDKPASSVVNYGLSAGNYTDSVSDPLYNYSHSIILKNLQIKSTYYFKATSVDSNGNTAISTEGSFTTQDTLVAGATTTTIVVNTGGGTTVIDNSDKVPPVISQVSVSNIDSGQATVVWNTNEAADSMVEFGSTNTYGSVSASRTTTTNHSEVLDNLLPDTQYYYRITSADGSGNVSQPYASTFTTPALFSEPTSSAPDNGLGASSTPTDQAANDSKFTEMLQKTINFIKQAAKTVSLSVLESSLVDQQNTLRELSALTPGPKLVSGPTIKTWEDMAIVSWDTDQKTNSLVSFAGPGVSPNNQAQAQEVGNSEVFAQNHQVVLSGLQPGTTYNYILRGQTPIGSSLSTPVAQFTTLVKAAKVDNYVADKISNTKASFRWVSSIPTDSTVRITPYRNNVLASDETKIVNDPKMTSIHEVSIDTFEPGVFYRVDLSGRDSLNNTLSQSIDTFSTTNQEPPLLVEQVKTDSALTAGNSPQVQSIISWTTTRPATSKVYYRQGTFADDSNWTNQTTLDNNYTRNHLVVMTNFIAGEVYQFQVESTDSNGKTVRSQTHTILTPRQQESVFQLIMNNIVQTFGWMGVVKS